MPRPQEELDDILNECFGNCREGMEMDWSGQRGDAILQVTTVRQTPEPDDPEKSYAISLIKGLKEKLDELQTRIINFDKEDTNMAVPLILPDTITKLIQHDEMLNSTLSSLSFMQDAQNNAAREEIPYHA